MQFVWCAPFVDLMEMCVCVCGNIWSIMRLVIAFYVLLFKIRGTCSFLRIVIGWCRKMCIYWSRITIDTMQKAQTNPPMKCLHFKASRKCSRFLSISSIPRDARFIARQPKTIEKHKNRNIGTESNVPTL